MNVHCATTYGCVKLIEEALVRPAHRPTVRKPHLSSEYEAMDTRDGKVIVAQLRRRWHGTEVLLPVTVAR